MQCYAATWQAPEYANLHLARRTPPAAFLLSLAPVSYHLCNTRHACHSFCLDYSPNVGQSSPIFLRRILG
jgi:hypothetical protein